MPLNNIQVVELFDVWGIDFMSSFSSTLENMYIMLALNYMSKWVEAVPCKTNGNKIVVKFLKENIFSMLDPTGYHP